MDLVEDELKIWEECNVDIEELLSLCFDGDFWYAGFRVLKPKIQISMMLPFCGMY